MSTDQSGTALAAEADRPVEISVHCPADGRLVGRVATAGPVEIAAVGAELRAARFPAAPDVPALVGPVADRAP